MIDMNGTDNCVDEIVTKDEFEFLEKIYKMKDIYVRAFQKSMIAEMDKDLSAHFTDENEMFKDIKEIVIKHLSSYMDAKFCEIINEPEMQDKLQQYYELDKKYKNKSIKFAILSAEEESNLKSNAIDQLEQKRKSMHELIEKTEQLKNERCAQLEQVFQDLAVNICRYHSIGGQEFDKDDVFD